MDVKMLEWKMSHFADCGLFDNEGKEALCLARDIIATLRSTMDLSPNMPAKDIANHILENSASSNRPGRTDQEIIDQTNRLSKAVLLEWGVGYTVPEDYAFHLKKDENPRAQKAWDIACLAQEMLTDTDPNDALSNLEEDMQS